jgi:branched-chain amino acid aminotransferase
MSTDRTNDFRVFASAQPLPAAEREAILANPGFGVHFTDHMVAIDWDEERHWHDAQVRAFGPLTLSPASAVLHYGQEIFEGLKAFRHADGSIWSFRPEANGARMQHSAQRLALPELPVDLFVESIRQLVRADAAWVPSGGEASLYIRPFMIANEDFLGVRSARRVAYYVIASPAGAYFKDGVKPVSIWLSRDYARAGRGGTGSAKCGGNYAASLLPQKEAYANGCAQVLFLDAEHGKYVEELGGMNVFLVLRDGRVITPALSGSILAGITRASVIQLLKDRGHAVTERRIEIDEWIDGVRSGEIAEVFACGTAASISPIGVLKGRDFSVGDAGGQPGEVTMAIRKNLTDIQYGRIEDRHRWMTRLV